MKIDHHETAEMRAMDVTGFRAVFEADLLVAAMRMVPRNCASH